MTLTLRPLRADDEATVRGWLAVFLTQHRTWWAEGYGRTPEAHIAELVEREWQELLVAADSERSLVAVLEHGGQKESRQNRGGQNGCGQPLGIVQAGVRADRTLGFQIGALQWIYLDPEARGRGLADDLMRRALAWMDAQGVSGREVFVTALNPAAVRLYRRHGFEVADHRMLAPAPSPLP